MYALPVDGVRGDRPLQQQPLLTTIDHKCMESGRPSVPVGDTHDSATREEKEEGAAEDATKRKKRCRATVHDYKSYLECPSTHTVKVVDNLATKYYLLCHDPLVPAQKHDKKKISFANLRCCGNVYTFAKYIKHFRWDHNVSFKKVLNTPAFWELWSNVHNKAYDLQERFFEGRPTCLDGVFDLRVTDDKGTTAAGASAETHQKNDLAEPAPPLSAPVSHPSPASETRNAVASITENNISIEYLSTEVDQYSNIGYTELAGTELLDFHVLVEWHKQHEADMRTPTLTSTRTAATLQSPTERHDSDVSASVASSSFPGILSTPPPTEDEAHTYADTRSNISPSQCKHLTMAPCAIDVAKEAMLTASVPNNTEQTATTASASPASTSPPSLSDNGSSRGPSPDLPSLPRLRDCVVVLKQLPTITSNASDVPHNNDDDADDGNSDISDASSSSYRPPKQTRSRQTTREPRVTVQDIIQQWDDETERRFVDYVQITMRKTIHPSGYAAFLKTLAGGGLLAARRVLDGSFFTEKPLTRVAKHRAIHKRNRETSHTRTTDDASSPKRPRQDATATTSAPESVCDSSSSLQHVPTHWKKAVCRNLRTPKAQEFNYRKAEMWYVYKSFNNRVFDVPDSMILKHIKVSIEPSAMVTLKHITLCIINRLCNAALEHLKNERHTRTITGDIFKIVRRVVAKRGDVVDAAADTRAVDATNNVSHAEHVILDNIMHLCLIFGVVNKYSTFQAFQTAYSANEGDMQQIFCMCIDPSAFRAIIAEVTWFYERVNVMCQERQVTNSFLKMALVQMAFPSRLQMTAVAEALRQRHLINDTDLTCIMGDGYSIEDVNGLSAVLSRDYADIPPPDSIRDKFISKLANAKASQMTNVHPTAVATVASTTFN